MINLAINGHAMRGSEVIELLEMLGGVNTHNLYGDENYAYYTIDSDKEIKGGIYVFGDEQLCHFTLEEFEEKFPYKVGDKVRNAKINDFIGRITNARWDSNEEQIIYTVEWDDATKSTLTYSARGLQPYKEETMEDKSNLLQQLKDYFDNTPKEVVEKEWHEYDKYNEISPKVNEYLEYINNIRKPKYPKTYEECCEMKNLYLVTLNSDTRILIVVSEEDAVGDYCLPVMHFGEWIESIEFIAIVGGDYQEGEILKRF